MPGVTLTRRPGVTDRMEQDAPAFPSEAIDLLRELLAEMRGLRADLRSGSATHLPDEARFVAAVAASVQGRVFSIAELRAHALIHGDLQRAIGALTNQRLGKKLRDLAGRDVGGFVVTRVTRDESGVVWAVSATSDLQGGAGLGADRGA